MSTQQILWLRWTKEEGCPICHDKEIRLIYRHLGSDFFCQNCCAVYAGSESRYPDCNPHYFTGRIFLEGLRGGIKGNPNLEDLKGALEALRIQSEKFLS